MVLSSNGCENVKFSFDRGRTLIYDPWLLEVSDNVTIGTGATIVGHIGDGPNVKLGRVAIEAGAVVGVNAVLFPDVRVGENARVAAGAVVVGGTRIAKMRSGAAYRPKRFQVVHRLTRARSRAA